MREYMYYETLAGALMDINPGDMFDENRKGNVPLARQFCMMYRKNELSMSLGEAGSRYSKDHATVLHARKVIKNGCETNRQFKMMWDLFIRKCNEERKRIQGSLVDKTDVNGLNVFLTELDKRHSLIIFQIYSFMNGIGDNSKILINIKNYKEELDELYKILSV